MTQTRTLHRTLFTLATVAAAALVPTVARAQDANKTYTLAEVEQKPALASVTNFQRLVADGYPEEQRKRRQGGIAEVAFVVDAQGRVEPGSVEVVGASEPAFGEAAKRALLQTGFRPGKVSGAAVRTKVSLPIVYRVQ